MSAPPARAAQFEHHDHRAPLPLVTLVALALLGLDTWAAYSAAETIGADGRVTLLWAALFLVISGLLVARPNWPAGRGQNICRVIGAELAILALAGLRLGFLAADGGLVAPVVGACMFAVCTMTLAAGGFAASRHAETMTISRARRRARRAAGTRSGLTRSWADVAAPVQLAPGGLLLERRARIPRGQAKEISHASAIAWP